MHLVINSPAGQLNRWSLEEVAFNLRLVSWHIVRDIADAQDPWKMSRVSRLRSRPDQRNVAEAAGTVALKVHVETSVSAAMCGLATFIEYKLHELV
jgi:hypothetical protein